jgi:hypothetical protein
MIQWSNVPVFQTEGRDAIFLSTVCTASSWSVVVSSDAISRSLFLQALSGNTGNICLGTGPNRTTDACVSTMASVELATSATYTTFSKEGIWCRSVQGSQTLKGKRTRDRSDFGYIGKNQN